MSFNFEISHDISVTDIDMFESLSKVDRFASMLGLSHDKDESEQNIALRRFEKARIKACDLMFDDVDLQRITAQDCDRIINTVAQNQNRFLLSALKLVPAAYGQWKEDKTGKLKEYPVPDKTSKSVSVILEKFGLSWSRSSIRVNGKIENCYKVSKDDYDKMFFYANQRYKKKDEPELIQKEHPEVTAIRKRIGK